MRSASKVVGVVALVLVAGLANALPASALVPAMPTSPRAAAAAIPGNDLTGVSCTSSTFCIAVGNYSLNAAAPSRALVERWDGKKWSSLGTAHATGTGLTGVSCTSPTFCIAVGAGTATGRWNGKQFLVASALKVAGASSSSLAGVSCVSPTFCFAVGVELVNGGSSRKTLAERWNGKTWSVVASPNVSGAVFISLNGVSCTSTLGCMAVGSYDTGDGREPTLVERWDGKKWAIVASPTPDVGSGAVLSAVSCVSAGNCFAAGYNNIGGAGRPTTLIERWNGKSWSMVTDSKPSGFSELHGVSCAGTTTCMAVGYSQAAARFSFGPPKTLVERWNGKTWSRVAGPSPGSTNSVLNAVSCTKATTCFAVGQSTNASGGTSAFSTAVERWNGSTWSTVASPNNTTI